MKKSFYSSCHMVWVVYQYLNDYDIENIKGVHRFNLPMLKLVKGYPL